MRLVILSFEECLEDISLLHLEKKTDKVMER